MATRIPEALLGDPKRLWLEYVAPALKTALAREPALHEVRATVEVELRDAGVWSVSIDRGAIELEEKRAERPDLILELDATELAEFVLGALSPSAALIDGRLQLAGDVALAMRLAPLLNELVLKI